MPQKGRSPGPGHCRTSPGESTGNTDPRDSRDPRNLPTLKGYQKLRLLKDLATSPSTPRELAHSHNLRLPALLRFRDAHKEEIAELSHAFQRGLPTDTSGMWITKKENRLAELEHEAEEIRNSLQDFRQNDIPWSRNHRDMIRTYLEILRTVADEIGAYPQRSAPPRQSGSTVHYIIDTDDAEQLQ